MHAGLLLVQIVGGGAAAVVAAVDETPHAPGWSSGRRTCLSAKLPTNFSSQRGWQATARRFEANRARSRPEDGARGIITCRADPRNQPQQARVRLFLPQTSEAAWLAQEHTS